MMDQAARSSLTSRWLTQFLRECTECDWVFSNLLAAPGTAVLLLEAQRILGGTRSTGGPAQEPFGATLHQDALTILGISGIHTSPSNSPQTSGDDKAVTAFCRAHLKHPICEFPVTICEFPVRGGMTRDDSCCVTVSL